LFEHADMGRFARILKIKEFINKKFIIIIAVNKVYNYLNGLKRNGLLSILPVDKHVGKHLKKSINTYSQNYSHTY